MAKQQKKTKMVLFRLEYDDFIALKLELVRRGISIQKYVANLIRKDFGVK